MSATAAADLPDITQALGVPPLPYAKAAILAAACSGAILCAIVETRSARKGAAPVRQAKRLDPSSGRLDTAELPKGARVVGYVAARCASIVPEKRDSAGHEALDRAAQEARAARTDWAFKHRR